jgi:hypothetical protein
MFRCSYLLVMIAARWQPRNYAHTMLAPYPAPSIQLDRVDRNLLLHACGQVLLTAVTIFLAGALTLRERRLTSLEGLRVYQKMSTLFLQVELSSLIPLSSTSPLKQTLIRLNL